MAPTIERYRREWLEGVLGTALLLLWLIVWLPVEAGRIQPLAAQVGALAAYGIWLGVPAVALTLAIAASRWPLSALLALWWRLRGLWLALVVVQAILLVGPWWWEAAVGSAASVVGVLGSDGRGAGLAWTLFVAAMVEAAVPVAALMVAAGWAGWWVQGRPLRVVLLGVIAPASLLVRGKATRPLAAAWLRFGLRVVLVLDHFSRSRATLLSSPPAPVDARPPAPCRARGRLGDAHEALKAGEDGVAVETRRGAPADSGRDQVRDARASAARDPAPRSRPFEATPTRWSRSPWAALVRGWTMAADGRLPDGSAVGDDPRSARVLDLVLRSHDLVDDAHRRRARSAVSRARRLRRLQYRAWRTLDDAPSASAPATDGAPSALEGRLRGVVVLAVMTGAMLLATGRWSLL